MKIKVGIISGGAFGTSIAMSIADELKQNDQYEDILTILVHNEVFNGVSQVDQINLHRENKKFLPGYKLPANIKATADNKEVEDWDIVFFAAPQQFFINVCEKIKIKKNALLISLTKGLLDDEVTTPCTYLKKKYNTSVFALMGANLATEIAEKKPSHSTLGYSSEDKEYVYDAILPMFKNIKIEPYPSYLGVELCGTFKNLIATVYGISIGLNLGANIRSAIFLEGIKELSSLLGLYNVSSELVFYSCGIQDLFVTCLYGRNKDCGYNIGVSKDTTNNTCQGIFSCMYYYKYLNSIGQIDKFPMVKGLYRIVSQKESDFKKVIYEIFEE